MARTGNKSVPPSSDAHAGKEQPHHAGLLAFSGVPPKSGRSGWRPSIASRRSAGVVLPCAAPPKASTSRTFGTQSLRPWLPPDRPDLNHGHTGVVSGFPPFRSEEHTSELQ